MKSFGISSSAAAALVAADLAMTSVAVRTFFGDGCGGRSAMAWSWVLCVAHDGWDGVKAVAEVARRKCSAVASLMVRLDGEEEEDGGGKNVK